MKRGDLFELLPEFHRVRDAERGNPLRVLMDALGTEAEALHANIGLLRDAWFIETCPDWVVPYIADLVGVDEALSGTGLPGLRSLVANTVAYQRARGTLATLGQAATAVTGWPSIAVDLAEWSVRGHTVRAGTGTAADARRRGTLRLSGATPPGASGEPPLGVARLSGSGARIRPVRGAPGPRASGLGLLVWRLRAEPLTAVEPLPLGQGRYLLNPLGVDSPLFTVPERSPISGRPATEADMPRRLTRALLMALLAGEAAPPVTVSARRAGQWRQLPRDQIRVADLGAWSTSSALGAVGSTHATAADNPADIDDLEATIDPERGRLLLRGGPIESLTVDHATASAARLGGGSYGRADRLIRADNPATWVARVTGRATAEMAIPAAPPGRALAPADTTAPRPFASLRDALRACPDDANEILIEIADSAIHYLNPPAPIAPDGEAARGLLDWSDPVAPRLCCGDRHVAIQAMDGFRPCVIGQLLLDGEDGTGHVDLCGLWWRGGVTLRGAIDLLVLDGAIWPDGGAAVAAVAAAAAPEHRTRLMLASSVTGPLRLPPLTTTLLIRASIVDGQGGLAIAGPAGPGAAIGFGPAPTLDEATVLGGVSAVTPPVLTDALVTGTIITPSGRVAPAATASFRCRAFGQPGYATLAEDCPPEIARGAADGGELGAFHAERRHDRMDSLCRVVDGYLPEGLSCGLHFMT